MSISRDLIRYIEGLTLSQGRYAGQPFPLLPFQKKWLKGAFSQPEDAALSVARANGKTTLCSAIACAAVDVNGPLVEPHAETLLIASSFAQGGVNFQHVLSFLQPTFEEWGIGRSGRFRVSDSQNIASIKDTVTGASIRVLGSDPKRLHGRAPRLLIFDEVSQWPPERLPAMLSALRTSRGKIPGSKALWIGTRPQSAEHPFQKALDGQGVGYAQSFHAEKDDYPFSRRTWRKANPGFAHLPDLVEVIEREAEDARKDPGAMQTFRALRLNQGVPDVLYSVLISADNWRIVEDLGDAEPLDRPRYLLAFDLGTSEAMSAAAACFNDGRVEAVACLPELPDLGTRGMNDGVGNLYQKMQDRGELFVAGRRISDVKALVQECRTRWGRPDAILCDSHRVKELRDCLEAVNFPRCPMIIRKRVRREEAAEDVIHFRSAVLAEKIRPSKSLLLRAALSEARTIVDPQGRSRLATGTAGGRRSEARDDAAAASILCIAEAWRRWWSETAAKRRHRRYFGAA